MMPLILLKKINLNQCYILSEHVALLGNTYSLIDRIEYTLYQNENKCCNSFMANN